MYIVTKKKWSGSCTVYFYLHVKVTLLNLFKRHYVSIYYILSQSKNLYKSTILPRQVSYVFTTRQISRPIMLTQGESRCCSSAKGPPYQSQMSTLAPAVAHIKPGSRHIFTSSTTATNAKMSPDQMQISPLYSSSATLPCVLYYILLEKAKSDLNLNASQVLFNVPLLNGNGSKATRTMEGKMFCHGQSCREWSGLLFIYIQQLAWVELLTNCCSGTLLLIQHRKENI